MFIRNIVFFLLFYPLFCYADQGVWTVASGISGIPASKLYAIALVESGKQSVDKRVRPWPWTINSPNGSLRLNSKEEAYREIRALVKSGVTNIDIGLMQINMRWHWNLVKNVDILDPSVNIITAASILKSNMIEVNGNVDKAIANYHSKRPAKGEEYKNSVLDYERQVQIAFRY